MKPTNEKIGEKPNRFRIKDFVEVVLAEDAQVPIGENTYVMRELIVYFIRVYGRKLSGRQFTQWDIAAWARNGRVPEIYGGHKITATRLSGLAVYTVEGLTREDVHSSHMLLAQRKEALIKANAATRREAKMPKRTALYYELARIKPPFDVLPKNWKVLLKKAPSYMRRKKSHRQRKKKII